jgi:hypothetical protein
MSVNIQSLGGFVKKYPVPVACAILSLILIFVLYMRHGIIDQLKVELESVNKEVKRYSTNIGNASQVQDHYDFLVKANDAVKSRTLAANSLATNLQYFYRLESEIGIKYLDLRPGGRAASKVVSKQSYVPLNYIITIQGSFEQILTYLKHIEHGVYFARINTASAAGSGSSLTVNLNVDLLGSP